MVKIIRGISENIISLRKLGSYRKLLTPAKPALSFDEFTIEMYNSKTDLNGVLNVMRKAYMLDSNTSIIYNMNKPETRLEYENFFCEVLDDGLSVVVRHLHTNQIVGFCVNNIQSRPQNGEPMFFEKCLGKYKDQSFRNYLVSRATRDNEINLFKNYQCDHIFEIVNVTTLAEFRGKKIGYNLMKSSTEIAKDAANGKCPSAMHKRFKGIIPAVVFASCSSQYSTKIALDLGFSIIKSIPFSEIQVNGASMADKVAPQHTHTSLVILKL